MFLDHSKSDIRARFFRSLDISVVHQYIRCPNYSHLLGRGFHFETFSLPTEGFPLAVSICRSQSHFSLPRMWLSSMERVLRLEHGLIPPMHIGELEDKIYYVQPCCDPKKPNKEKYRKELDSLFELLKSCGLVIHDYWQVMLFEQQPYVVDWSDLSRIES